MTAAIEITRSNFDTLVLAASSMRPVLVDFWAPWCGPCRSLAPILDRVAAQFAGRVTLVKLNTDEEPEIAARYQVRGIPNCKLFIDGQVADEFTGALPESAVRDFLARALPSPAASVIAAAKASLASDDPGGALEKLQQADALDPDNDDVLLTRAEALVALDRAQEADALLTRLEARDGQGTAEDRRLAALRARVSLAGHGDADLQRLAQQVADTPSDCTARLAYAQALAARGDYEQALAELLAIVRMDRSFGDDVARRTMLTIFEVLPGDSELVRRYRRELASALN
jgi:putative thioredoxin